MKKQRGAALMAMLAVLILGAAWWTVTAISKPINRTAEDRAHNAKVLQQAKVALVGYVGHQAAMTGENDPGRLPCPEAAANIGTANEGIAAGNCVLPAVGRLPWRTLGLDKLRDTSGEPLWYVVAPGWSKPNAATNTIINSHCTDPALGLACAAGQLNVDGAANAAVALIVAPGGPVQVQASANCTPRNQTRSVPSPAIDLRDYLECQNATSPADNTFATSGPGGSFNDQVLAITATELLPVIEAAVGARFVREFGPSLRYCGGFWPPCAGAGAEVYFPFAAPVFAPNPNPAASNFQGALNVTQGLAPLSFSATGGCQANTPVAPFCAPRPACALGSDNRCAPALVTYRNNPVITQTGSGSADVTIQNYNCAVGGAPNTLTCTLNTRYFPLTPVANRWITFTLDVTSNNVGMAMRQINAAVQMTGVDPVLNAPFGYTVDSAAMNNDASATVRITARVPGAGGGLVGDLTCGLLGFLLQLIFDCQQHTITLPFIWLDQPLLYANNATAAWFYRNGWHQLMYYAVAAGNAPSGAGACAPGVSCLSVFGLNPGNTQRAIAIVPGRALGAQVRPAAAPADWLEGGNVNLPLDSAFWARDPNLVVNRSFNDRVVVIDSN